MMTFIATSNEEDLLTHEVSDEALEAAGGNEARNFSMATCTYCFGCVPAKQPRPLASCGVYTQTTIDYSPRD